MTDLRRAGAGFALALAAIVLLLDQLSKHVIQTGFGQCDLANPHWLVPRWLALAYTCNSGAAFGVLPNDTVLFAAIAFIVCVVIASSLHSLPTGGLLLPCSLGLQLGGAMGNLIDRIRQGFVVDFVSVLNFPVFNLADACIVCGVAGFAVYLLTRDRAATAPMITTAR